MNLTITGIKELRENLNNAAREKLPSAVSSAINTTLRGAMQDQKKEIKDSFPTATPFILSSVLYEKSGKETLTGRIYISSEQKRKEGTPTPSQVLAPHVSGGIRSIKRSERSLRRIGVLGPNQFIVPGPQAPVDQYGNIPGPQMVKILSAAGLFNESGFLMNQTEGSGRKKGFAEKAYCVPFVGIFWRVTAKTTYPVLFFTNSPPQYEAESYDFYYSVKSYFNKNFAPNFRQAFQLKFAGR